MLRESGNYKCDTELRKRAELFEDELYQIQPSQTSEPVESPATDRQQRQQEIAAILDYLDMCSFKNFTAEKYDITKRRLRQLLA
jgi:hypothetical protein